MAILAATIRGRLHALELGYALGMLALLSSVEHWIHVTVKAKIVRWKD